MSGAVFQILNNDGKLDRIIFSNHILYARLNDVIVQKSMNEARYGGDVLPSYSDIEQTHVFFLNGVFRPVVQITFEYMIFTNAAGQSQFNKPVEYEINQAGEYWLDMMVHLIVDAPTTSATGKNTSATSPADVPFRWCDYPGERIMKNVAFTINAQEIDSYQANTYVFYRQFFLTVDRATGWNNCMGHENTKVGYGNQLSSAAATALAAGAYNHGWYNNRIQMQVADGPQTYKRDTAYNNVALELMIPILFWFNTDPRSAFPSISVPQGGRRIKVDLEQFSNMAYVKPAYGGATAGVLATPSISTAEIFVNFLYVPDFLHVIIVRRVQFSLVRLHRNFTAVHNKNSDTDLLQNSFKWPIEFFICGVIPSTSLLGGTTLYPDAPMDRWHRYTVWDETNNVVPYPMLDDLFNTITVGAPPAAIPIAIPAPTITANLESPTLTRLGFTAMAIDLYKEQNIKFYNSYIPLMFGRADIHPPTDPGLALVTFTTYPGTYQPAGHLNTSRAREMQLKLTMPSVSSTVTAESHVVGQAINFSVCADGSYSIRYHT